jgi:ABC-type bacteriocin/lantibiotic exporter with double-glycine peptidase domain
MRIVQVGRVRSKLYELRHRVLGAESVALSDAYSVSGIQDRKTGGKDFLPQLRGYAREWRRASVRTICLARTAFVPTSIVVGSLSPFLFLMMALMQMSGLTGEMSLTGILAMLAQLSIMASKLAGVTSGFQFAQDLRDTARGFTGMLKLEPELAPSDDAVLESSDPHNRSIRACGVKFMYRGTTDFVITDASCEIEPGSLVSVIGPSGEGKSTFAQILAGLLHPQQGEIWCGQHFLHALEAEVRKGLVAYMGQFAPAFRGTVREVFEDRWSDATEAEIKQVLAATGLWGELGKKKGLKTLASSLSGGQRQRLHFALIDFEIRREGPKIVIIDEGTSDLDLASERKIVARLRTMAQEGCTVIQVAHRTEAINAGTHILALENGKGSLLTMQKARQKQNSLYYRLVVSTGATEV